MARFGTVSLLTGRIQFIPLLLRIVALVEIDSTPPRSLFPVTPLSIGRVTPQVSEY